MTDQKLLNKTIQISAKEEKLQGGKPVYKIKDEKGLTYTIYKFKKNDSVSVAWDQITKLSVGDNVFIGYVENQGEYEGKTVTYRTILTLSTDISNGMMNASAQEKSFNPEPNREQYQESREAFGRRLAIHGMVNGLLAGGTEIDQIDSGVIEDLLELEDRIDVQLNASLLEPKATEPTIHIDGDMPPAEVFNDNPGNLNVEDIPF